MAGLGVPDGLDATWCTRSRIHRQGSGQTRALPASGSGSLSATEVGSGRSADDPPAAAEVTLVGVGSSSMFSGDRGLESLRRAAAAFVRAAGEGGSAVFLLPEDADLDVEGAAAAAAEGAALGVLPLRRLSLRGGPGIAGDAGHRRGGVGCFACRRRGRPGNPGGRVGALCARPGQRAPQLAHPRSGLPTSSSQRFADVAGVSVEVWDEERIVAERLGGLLGVARGSAQPPRLVRVEYQPADPVEVDGRVPHLVLVGKGITFDSGGLSLKTASGMETMKTDMGGAAAVMCAVDAAVAMGARIRISAIAPLTENMPGGSATKPGDVLTTRNGKTIEVLNTDAEGRLVLADGLALAVEADPDAIVDVATLTGAAVVALGKEIAGLLGNDDILIGQVRAAGERVGEALWPLPLPDDYRSHIESEIADMRNVGRPGQAGATSAAMLLREFVGEVPWAHLDIAGPARSDENQRYLSKGGTGFGVRTLVALITSDSFAATLVRHGDDVTRGPNRSAHATDR